MAELLEIAAAIFVFMLCKYSFTKAKLPLLSKLAEFVTTVLMIWLVKHAYTCDNTLLTARASGGSPDHFPGCPIKQKEWQPEVYRFTSILRRKDGARLPDLSRMR